MSGHRAMTSQEVQGQDIFLREMADYYTLEGDIDHDGKITALLDRQ